MSDFHTFKLGALDCISLMDFARERTPRVTFPKIDPADLEQEIAAAGLDLALDRPMSLHGVVLFIDNGQQKIMIDSGLPAAAGGQLIDSLAAAGLSPEDIDLLIVTHGDADHIGGLTRFPNAAFVLPKNAYELWTNDTDGMVEEFLKLFRGTVTDEELAQQAAGRRAYADVLANLEEAGRIRLVSMGEEIVPGIQMLAAPGHRRDHTAIEITSEGESLLHVADGFRHPLQLRRHDFYCLFDSYPEQLAQSMVMLLDKAAASGATVFGAHFEFPALIKITKDDAGYHWHTV